MTTIVTGYYGSGKTEFVLNLAMALARESGRRITIADLDVINPFFRSREREKALAPLGIEVMGSAIENHVLQDIPAISYAFLSRIRNGEDVIIDLAGGEAGLNLLASCYDAIGAYEFLCVFNMYRPETDTAQKMVDFCRSINAVRQRTGNADAVRRFPITGLVDNGNLLAYTEASHVLESQATVLQACKALNLPLKYTLVQEDIYKKIAPQVASEKVLTFAKPQMRKDWQK